MTDFENVPKGYRQIFEEKIATLRKRRDKNDKEIKRLERILVDFDRVDKVQEGLVQYVLERNE